MVMFPRKQRFIDDRHRKSFLRLGCGDVVPTKAWMGLPTGMCATLR